MVCCCKEHGNCDAPMLSQWQPFWIWLWPLAPFGKCGKVAMLMYCMSNPGLQREFQLQPFLLFCEDESI